LRRISLGARLGKLQLPDRAENWELLASFLTQPKEVRGRVKDEDYEVRSGGEGCGDAEVDKSRRERRSSEVKGNGRAWPQRLRGSAVPLARYAQFARDKIKSKDVTMSKRSCLS
jgi:hypothetical protein